MVALDQRGIGWVDARGRVTARMPVDAFAGEGIISEIEVVRDDLAAVLHEATRARVEYVFGDSVTGLRQDDDGVDVTFEHAPPRRFALVIGADGLYSPIRRLVFGDADLHPLGCVMAWFSAPPTDLDGWYLMHNAPGGRVASLRPGRTPGATKAGLGLRVDPRTAPPRDADGQRHGDVCLSIPVVAQVPCRHERAIVERDLDRDRGGARQKRRDREDDKRRGRLREAS